MSSAAGSAQAPVELWHSHLITPHELVHSHHFRLSERFEFFNHCNFENVAIEILASKPPKPDQLSNTILRVAHAAINGATIKINFDLWMNSRMVQKGIMMDMKYLADNEMDFILHLRMKSGSILPLKSFPLIGRAHFNEKWVMMRSDSSDPLSYVMKSRSVHIPLTPEFESHSSSIPVGFWKTMFSDKPIPPEFSARFLSRSQLPPSAPALSLLDSLASVAQKQLTEMSMVPVAAPDSSHRVVRKPIRRAPPAPSSLASVASVAQKPLEAMSESSSSASAGKKRGRLARESEKTVVPVVRKPICDKGGVRYLFPYSKARPYLTKAVTEALTDYSLAHIEVKEKDQEAYSSVLTKKMIDLDLLPESNPLKTLLKFIKHYNTVMEDPIGLPTFLHVGEIKEMGNNLGVFAREDIASSTFLGCYSGEFVSRATLDDTSYVFAIDEAYAVDAKKKGNYLRYLNHTKSEFGNIHSTFFSYLNSDGIKTLFIAFYTCAFIPKGEQLQYSYGPKYDWSHIPGGKPKEDPANMYMLDTTTGEISSEVGRRRPRKMSDG